jgi:hypothetical protein
MKAPNGKWIWMGNEVNKTSQLIEDSVSKITENADKLDIINNVDYRKSSGAYYREPNEKRVSSDFWVGKSDKELETEANNYIS